MTAKKITVDDLKAQAETIRDTAVDEVKRVGREDTTKIIVAGIVVAAVVVSAAYYMGSRRCSV